jgi:peptidoglycan/xylan/chitin deacetylase (PgdA/CDA1 family)
MKMAENDAEREARRRRVRMLKKLIIIIPLSTILILFVLCVILSIRLYCVSKELRELRTQINTTPVMLQVNSVEAPAAEPADDTDADSVSPTDSREQDETAGQDETEDQYEAAHQVFLTFDDGPSSNTGRILDILAEYDVKATFFVVGKEEDKYQALYKRIVDEGHTLGMHSYSHVYDEIYQSVDSYAADLTKLQDFLYDTTGVRPRYCRFPGGSSNTVSDVDMHELIAYLDDRDMEYFDWNISSGDAASSYISPEDIIRNCTGNISSFHEAMILMHDASNKDSTVEALPKLIETIQAMEDTKIVPITDQTEPIHHISND